MTIETKVDCPHFDNCGAPLCPLQENALEVGIWYPDEEICRAKRFQTLGWVRKQKGIVKAKALADRYFTVEMLQAIRRVHRGIEGINPDQPLKEAEDAERKWVEQRKGTYNKANKIQGSASKTSGKRDNLVLAGKTAH
jgi:hypothetical protein